MLYTNMNYTHYYNTYKDKIYSYFLYNLGQDVSLAEDLTSDTFLKVFEKFSSYDETYKFSTWIYTIARNVLYDHYRKNNIKVSIEDVSELDEKVFLGYEQDFIKQIDVSIQMTQIIIALEKLPVTQREVIVMKYLDDFSTKEISSMTAKTPANIRKILSRWLDSLRNTCAQLPL